MRFFNHLLGSNPLDYGAIAVAAESAGFDGIALADHVIHPERIASVYPYSVDGKPIYSDDERWPDPWVAIGAMASLTERIEFLTNIYVLPSRNPFVVAKAVGTAAVLSRGRVRLGVGAGWMKEEFDALGQPFAGRGKRMDEMIDVLRLLWTGEVVEHHGAHFDFDRLHVSPAPEDPVPIYIGGDSDVAFRRAAQRGDGWVGVYHTLEELKVRCETLRRLREDAGTADRPFDIVASPIALPHPDVIEELEAMGVTTMATSAWIASGLSTVDRSQAVDLISSFGERFIAPLRV